MNTTEHLCMINRTLESLIVDFERYKISIFDYKLYIDDDSEPIILKSESDYEPYLKYHPYYIIENATFDNITYHKAIRVLSPKT